MNNKTREVVLDTETTGLNFNEGDRVIEIGCVELINRIPTGKTFQTYINPESKKVEEEKETLLFFGRIWKYKGLEYLIKSEPLITSRIPNLKIIIAGTGEDFQRYDTDGDGVISPEEFEKVKLDLNPSSDSDEESGESIPGFSFIVTIFAIFSAIIFNRRRD